jgi:hypothetical protein
MELDMCQIYFAIYKITGDYKIVCVNDFIGLFSKAATGVENSQKLL